MHPLRDSASHDRLGALFGVDGECRSFWKRLREIASIVMGLLSICRVPRRRVVDAARVLTSPLRDLPCQILIRFAPILERHEATDRTAVRPRNNSILLVILSHDFSRACRGEVVPSQLPRPPRLPTTNDHEVRFINYMYTFSIFSRVLHRPFWINSNPKWPTRPSQQTSASPAFSTSSNMWSLLPAEPLA